MYATVHYLGARSANRPLLAVISGVAGLAEQGGEVEALVGDDPEPLGDHWSVVVDRERGVAEFGPQLIGVPEGLVGGAPFGHGAEALALADGVRQIDVGQPGHPDGDHLDECDRLA